jgi:transglutaminase/protease-like cytokinesis protein 3
VNLKGIIENEHINNINLNNNPLNNIDDLMDLTNYEGSISILDLIFSGSSVKDAINIFNEVKMVVNFDSSNLLSDYDKAKKIHDYIVINFEYDYENYLKNTIPWISYTPFGLFLNRKGVCYAYAQTYNLILKYAGIESYVVIGKAIGGDHAWNYVIIDGVGYHVDTTWDDPVPNRPGYVRHNYFMLSDEQIGRDHSNWVIQGYNN